VSEVAPETIIAVNFNFCVRIAGVRGAANRALGKSGMEMNWSRWFHCESSFGLLLVPSQPGIFALAEEVAQAAGPDSRRMLAVFEVEEADDLLRAMSRLFLAGSPWREKLSQECCYVRYAVAPGIADRRAAATALKTWLSSQRGVAAQIFGQQIVGQQIVGQQPLASMRTAPGNDAELLAAGEMQNERLSSAGYEYEAPDETELKTIAERAVDRVTHGIRLRKAFPAGF
jgi:hypothetical protein